MVSKFPQWSTIWDIISTITKWNGIKLERNVSKCIIFNHTFHNFPACPCILPCPQTSTKSIPGLCSYRTHTELSLKSPLSTKKLPQICTWLQACWDLCYEVKWCKISSNYISFLAQWRRELTSYSQSRGVYPLGCGSSPPPPPKEMMKYLTCCRKIQTF